MPNIKLDFVLCIKRFISFRQAKHNFFYFFFLTLNSEKFINVISNRLLQVFGVSGSCPNSGKSVSFACVGTKRRSFTLHRGSESHCFPTLPVQILLTGRREGELVVVSDRAGPNKDQGCHP